MDVKS